MSQPKGYASTLPIVLQRLAKLYRAGLIDDSSTVWCNTNVSAPVMWVLADTTWCVYWLNAGTAGWVRITTDRVRWAPTQDATKRDAPFDLDLTTLASILPAQAPVLVVVDHNFIPPGVEGVGVVVRSLAQEVTGGFYRGSRVSVVDLPNYDAARRERGTVDQAYAQAAHFHGLQLLTAGMPPTERDYTAHNLTRHSIELGPAIMRRLCDALDVFTLTAGHVVHSIYGTDGPAPGDNLAP